MGEFNKEDLDPITPGHTQLQPQCLLCKIPVLLLGSLQLKFHFQSWFPALPSHCKTQLIQQGLKRQQGPHCSFQLRTGFLTFEEEQADL